jgi:putative phosphoribosyl transferase
MYESYAGPLFRDRTDAGRILADRLAPYLQDQNVLILALPRGGVPVGFEVAKRFNADLDVFIVRKIGVPGQEELAMGAVASGGVRVLNDSIVQELGISRGIVDQATEREKREIERREWLYREGRPALNPAGRTVVLVDDGVATGATMLAAARSLRLQRPKRIIVAVPVASSVACDEFRAHVEEVVCAETPEPFYAVGVWYGDFAQTTDDEVRTLLERASRQHVA